MTKRLLITAVVLAMLLVACGGGASTLAEGTLTVCTDAPYEPFEIYAEDGTLTGFDMDMIAEVANRMGLEMEPTVQPFEGIWLQPDAGTCDVVVAAMTITEERAAQALFADPYFDADQSLLVRSADAGSLTDLDALVGKKVGVQVGTTGEIYAEENSPAGVEIVSFDEAAGMFLSLASGDIDAILQDLPVNGYRSTQDDAFVVTAKFPTGEQYGFASSLDNTELIDEINTILAEMREDGGYDEIYREYFGTGS
ncbi:MAG TPA: transporter substrate-binding domain-containing protein [Acidimicrobiia bacterium]|nr:transporter substrate-binding domain-containing protein [Acidimicrobiia bacterium]